MLLFSSADGDGGGGDDWPESQPVAARHAEKAGFDGVQIHAANFFGGDLRSLEFINHVLGTTRIGYIRLSRHPLVCAPTLICRWQQGDALLLVLRQVQQLLQYRRSQMYVQHNFPLIIR